jgi:hypothetical protein
MTILERARTIKVKNKTGEEFYCTYDPNNDNPDWNKDEYYKDKLGYDFVKSDTVFIATTPEDSKKLFDEFMNKLLNEFNQSLLESKEYTDNLNRKNKEQYDNKQHEFDFYRRSKD